MVPLLIVIEIAFGNKGGQPLRGALQQWIEKWSSFFGWLPCESRDRRQGTKKARKVLFRFPDMVREGRN